MGLYKDWLARRELKESALPMSKETVDSMMRKLKPINMAKVTQFIQQNKPSVQQLEKVVTDLLHQQSRGPEMRLPNGMPVPPVPRGQGYQQVMSAPPPPRPKPRPQPLPSAPAGAPAPAPSPGT